jgi:hypothetical protein
MRPDNNPAMKTQLAARFRSLHLLQLTSAGDSLKLKDVFIKKGTDLLFRQGGMDNPVVTHGNSCLAMA